MALIDKLTAIAEAIRGKTGKEDKLTLEQMAAEIEGITGGLKYDMGTFMVSSSSIEPPYYIAHNLGEAPNIIFVWTDEFKEMSESEYPYSTSTALGFVAIDTRSFIGLPQRLTSTVTNTYPFLTIDFYLYSGDSRINVMAPTSTAYVVNWNPTDTGFRVPKMSASIYWREGVEYKYFVARVQ